MSEYLKCDAEGCNYRKEYDVVGEDLIDTPCPVCGANLLTRSDFEAFAALMQITRLVDAAVSKVIPPEKLDPGEVHLHYHDGKITMEVLDGGKEGQRAE